MKRIVSFAVAVCLMISLCSVWSIAETTKSLSDMTIVAFGDSITARDGSYVPKVSSQIGNDIINAGVNGNMTRHARERFESDVLDKKPDLVLICFGMNDQAAYLLSSNNSPCVGPETYRENLAYFADTLIKKGSDVVFVTPNPVNTQPGYYVAGAWDMDYGYGYMDVFCNIMREVAEEYNCDLIDMNCEFRNLEDADQYYNIGDGVHPNNQGFQFYADCIAGYLRAKYEGKDRASVKIKCIDENDSVLNEVTFVGKAGAKMDLPVPRIRGMEVKNRPQTSQVILDGEQEFSLIYQESANVATKATYEVHDFFRMGGAEVNWSYSETAPITYGDETGSQLTDGRHAETCGFGDTAWVGLSSNHPNYGKNGQYVLFTLSQEEQLDKVVITVNHALENAIGAPSKITVYTSLDGENFSSGVTGAYEDTLKKGESATYIVPVKAKAKYVKVSFTPRSGYSWMFFDEIEIYRSTFKRGDVDGNGVVEAKDYIKLKRFVLQTYQANEDEKVRMDVNLDKKVDSKDYIMLKRAVLNTYSLN